MALTSHVASRTFPSAGVLAVVALLLLAGVPTTADGTAAAAARERFSVSGLPADVPPPAIQPSAPPPLVGGGADFERNIGQQPHEVLFFSRGPGYTLFITETEFVTVLSPPRTERLVRDRPWEATAPLEAGAPPAARSGVIRMSLVGAAPAPVVTGEGILDQHSNYFLGNDSAKWRLGVPHFAQVRVTEVYPGIDMVWYGRDGALEYDFLVAPGADPGLIRMVFDGAAGSLAQDGALVLATPGGDVLHHAAPRLFQGEGWTADVDGWYALLPGGVVGFHVGAYDATRVLRIDPVLAYATYHGGSNAERGYGIAAEAGGAAIAVGETCSLDFPLVNATQSSMGGGCDVFVSKFNPGGGRVYSTYLGGAGDDGGRGIALDGGNVAYVTGHTCSANFPTASAPYQGSHGGGCDAFIAKFDPGGGLLFSTYLGGDANDYGRGIAVDGNNAAYATGYTCSANFPTSTGAYQAGRKGCHDAFVSKLAPGGGSLTFSTFLGGSNDDLGNAIAVDPSGAAYVTGRTAPSSDFPIVNAYDATHAGGNRDDAFLTKVSPDGGSLVYSTFLGGGSCDEGFGVAVDASGSAYVAGSSCSHDFPVHSAFQSTNGGGSHWGIAGCCDAFVTKFGPAGNTLVFSTYLGGSAGEYATAIAVDANGASHLAGWTCSPDFPTQNATQPALGSCTDGFLATLGPSGTTLHFGTYLGGTREDEGHAIAVDASGSLAVTGNTCSLNFPLHNPVQVSNGGSGCYDAFVVRLAGCSGPATTPSLSGSPGQQGWWRSAVAVTLSVAGSCPPFATYTSLDGGPFLAGPSRTVSDEGNHTLAYYSVDHAGNAEPPRSISVKIDATPPTIAPPDRTPGPNPAGWNNVDVVLAWSCTDGTSGPVSKTVTQTVTGEGEQLSATGTCADLAGNSASDSVNDIRIDRTPPTIARRDNITTAATSATGAVVHYVAPAAGDDRSGPGTVTCDLPSGSEFSIGNHTVTCSVHDLAGNGPATSTFWIDVTGRPASAPRNVAAHSPQIRIAPLDVFVRVTWDDPIDLGTGFECYQVERRFGTGPGRLLPGCESAREFRDRSCPLNATCAYRIRAMGAVAGAWSEWSMSVRGTAAPTPATEAGQAPDSHPGDWIASPVDPRRPW